MNNKRLSFTPLQVTGDVEPKVTMMKILSFITTHITYKTLTVIEDTNLPPKEVQVYIYIRYKCVFMCEIHFETQNIIILSRSAVLYNYMYSAFICSETTPLRLCT